MKLLFTVFGLFLFFQIITPELVFAKNSTQAERIYWLEHSTFNPKYGGATLEEVVNPENSAFLEAPVSSLEYNLEHSTFNPKYGRSAFRQSTNPIESNVLHLEQRESKEKSTPTRIFLPTIRWDSSSERLSQRRNSYHQRIIR